MKGLRADSQPLITLPRRAPETLSSSMQNNLLRSSNVLEIFLSFVVQRGVHGENDVVELDSLVLGGNEEIWKKGSFDPQGSLVSRIPGKEMNPKISQGCVSRVYSQTTARETFYYVLGHV